MNQGLIAALAVFAAAAVNAQEVPVFRYLPEPAFETIVAKSIEPLKSKDAFAGLAECAVVDARTFKPVTSAEAEQMLAPCVQGVSKRYNQPVRVERMAQQKEESMGVQIEGLALYVPEHVAVTDALMRDLNHALTARGGRILGHPVVVRRAPLPSENKPAFGPGLQTKSALQNTLDGCMHAQVTRRIESSEQFIALYGRCIILDSKLRVSDVRPAAGRPLGVTLQSGADDTVVRSLNGLVRVDAENGPVVLSVVAYSERVALQ